MASRVSYLLDELRRRAVFRVATLHVAVGLSVLGAAERIMEPFGLHDRPEFPGVLNRIGLGHLMAHLPEST